MRANHTLTLSFALARPCPSYLQERGLDMPLLEYLVEISIDKEQREYVNWLKRTLAFVGKSK